MKQIQQFFIDHHWIVNIIYAFITIIIAVVLYNIIARLIRKAFKQKHLANSKRAATYLDLIINIVKYTILALVIIALLKLYGINISSILAGIGILGIIIGLAIQDYLKDLIRGTCILTDNYFSVGDIIKYGETEGKIVSLGLRTTKIEELKTNNIISVANRNIEEIAVLSKYIYVRVPLPYELSLEEQHKIVDDIIELSKADKLIKDCSSVGVADLADSKIEYLLKVTINPANKLQARRNVLEHILEGMEKNNVAVPYNQLDIHQK